MRVDLKWLALAAPARAGGVASGRRPAGARQGARMRRPRPRGAEAPGVSPAEIQRMFDSYTLIQAQDQLKISDDQFPQFLTRFKALQDTRRQNLQERIRIVQDLRRLANDAQPDEAQMKERLKALDDLDARAQARSQRRRTTRSTRCSTSASRRSSASSRRTWSNRKLELITRARQAQPPQAVVP